MRLLRARGDDPCDEGFTLIELLVVIVIIGILSAIAIPVFLGQRQKAWRTEALSDMKSAAISVESYVTEPAHTYADLDGATHMSPLLQDEGFRNSVWVGLRVVSDMTSYCIEGTHVNLPAETFVYRSEVGKPQVVGEDGVVTC